MYEELFVTLAEHLNDGCTDFRCMFEVDKDQVVMFPDAFIQHLMEEILDVLEA